MGMIELVWQDSMSHSVWHIGFPLEVHLSLACFISSSKIVGSKGDTRPFHQMRAITGCAKSIIDAQCGWNLSLQMQVRANRYEMDCSEKRLEVIVAH